MKYINGISISLLWNSLLLLGRSIDRSEYIRKVNSRLSTRYENIGNTGLDSSKQYIIISNHRSIYDILILFGFLYQNNIYNISGIGKKKHIYSAVLSRLVSTENGTPFPWAGDKNLIPASLQIINDGYNFLIFPEGRRNYSDKKIQRFRQGADSIINRIIKSGLDVPILMFYIENSDKILPDNFREASVKYYIISSDECRNGNIEDIYKNIFLP